MLSGPTLPSKLEQEIVLHQSLPEETDLESLSIMNATRRNANESLIFKASELMASTYQTRYSVCISRHGDKSWWKTMLLFSQDFVMILRWWCSLIKSFIKLEDLIGTNLIQKTVIYSVHSNNQDGFVLHEISCDVTIKLIPNPYFISSV